MDNSGESTPLTQKVISSSSEQLRDGELDTRCLISALKEGESVESALRRFKRKVQAENIIGEVKRHSYYLKPGEKRRVKQALARKRARKKFRKDSE